MTTPTIEEMRRDLDDWRGYPASGEADTPDMCEFCGGGWDDHKRLFWDRDGSPYEEARMCPIDALASALKQLEAAEALIRRVELVVVYAATVLQPENDEDLPGKNALEGLNAAILDCGPVVCGGHAALPPAPEVT